MSLPVRARQLLGGFMVTQALGVAARLDLAELVAERPRTADELAGATGADADALRRLLRTLASIDVFAHDEGGIVRNTELSELLRDSAPGSIRWIAHSMSGEHYRAWADAPESFATGKPAFPRVFGAPYFDWLADHPREAEVFNRAMGGSASMRQGALVAADWSQTESVVDVGGGTGTMLAAVLGAHEHLRGVVFDLPLARSGAEETIAAAGLSGRCSFVAGSFFEAVPEGADAYVLSQILHDWEDDRAAAILRVCRAAARPDSRLLLVEGVLAPGDAPDWKKLLDLHMLVLVGGRERTADEWEALLAAGGFRLDRIVDGDTTSVLEASPA